MIQRRRSQEGRALANTGGEEGWKEGIAWQLIGKDEWERCLVDTACSGTLGSGSKKTKECTGGQSAEKVDNREHGDIYLPSMQTQSYSIGLPLDSEVFNSEHFQFYL